MATKKIPTKLVDNKNSLKTVPPLTETIVRYLDKNVKISPRKLRLLANVVKKMSPSVALNHLQIENSKSARVLLKAIKTATADCQNNHKLDQKSLKFTSILVNEGIKYKRMDKSHSSRFSRGLIQKRHSRLTINIKGYKTN